MALNPEPPAVVKLTEEQFTQTLHELAQIIKRLDSPKDPDFSKSTASPSKAQKPIVKK